MASQIRQSVWKLGYLHPKKGKRLRKFIALIFMDILIVFAAVKRNELFALYEQGSYLLDQWRYTSHAFPSNTIAYDEDPSSAPQLFSRSRSYRGLRPLFGREGIPPKGWVMPAVFAPPALNTLGIGDPQGAVCYVGRRRSGLGVERIVRAYVGTAAFEFRGHSIYLETDTWLSAKFQFNSRIVRASERHGSLHLKLASTEYLRVNFGQDDPDDESHFTLQYQVNGVEGTIDGWLKDVKDSGEEDVASSDVVVVALKARSGPLSDYLKISTSVLISPAYAAADDDSKSGSSSASIEKTPETHTRPFESNGKLFNCASLWTQHDAVVFRIYIKSDGTMRTHDFVVSPGDEIGDKLDDGTDYSTGCTLVRASTVGGKFHVVLVDSEGNVVVRDY